MQSKRERMFKLTAAMVLPMVWSAGTGAAHAGPPRNASATVVRTGSAGNASTRQSNLTTNGQGGYTAGSTVTGPAGNAASRQQSGAYNAATQTYSRSGTSTGPNGRTSGFNTSLQATGNGLNRNATRTGPNGNSATASGSLRITQGTPPTGN